VSVIFFVYPACLTIAASFLGELREKTGFAGLSDSSTPALGWVVWVVVLCICGLKKKFI
jgi:hypothetical protein